MPAPAELAPAGGAARLPGLRRKEEGLDHCRDWQGEAAPVSDSLAAGASLMATPPNQQKHHPEYGNSSTSAGVDTPAGAGRKGRRMPRQLSPPHPDGPGHGLCGGATWPLVPAALAGARAELQRARRAPGAVNPVFRLPLCSKAAPVGLAAGFARTPWPPASGISLLSALPSGQRVHLGMPNRVNPRQRLFPLAAEPRRLKPDGLSNNDRRRSVKRNPGGSGLERPGQRPAVLGLNLGNRRSPPGAGCR